MATLNEDVLDTIFSHLNHKDLASTALACRLWVFLSQRRLYYRVHFTDDGGYRRHNSLRRSRMVKLASTLGECDNIRHLIRSLRVEFWGTIPDVQPLYEWIRLLPPKRIHSMAIMGRSKEFFRSWFASTVLACPALPDVRHLVTEGVFQFVKTGHGLEASRQGFTMESFAHLPCLESLRIDDYSFPLLGPTSQFTPLKCFNAHVHTYDKSVRAVVQQHRSSLKYLALSIDNYGWEGWNRSIADIMGEDLSTFSRLRHLFMFSALFGHHRGPSRPFMDEVIEHLPELETLFCGSMSFSGNLLGRVPRTLHTLRLETTAFYSEEIMGACARKQEDGSSLRLLELGDPEFPKQPKHSDKLIAHCAGAGITLRLLHVNDWDNRNWYDDKRAFAIS